MRRNYANFKYNEAERVTRARKLWVTVTWLFSWWIPSFLLRVCGGLKTSETRMAWREKFLIVSVVFIACATTLFFNVALPMILCPRENVLTLGELSAYNTTKKYVGAYGRYYDFGPLLDKHVQHAEDVDINFVLGKDVSDMFYPALDWKRACPHPDIPDPGSNWDNLSHERNTRRFWPHIARNPETGAVKDFMGILNRKNSPYLKGDIVWDVNEVRRQASNHLKFLIILDNVYDVTSYTSAPEPFFDPLVTEMFDKFAGADASNYYRALAKSNPAYYVGVLQCMNNVFYVGRVDHRRDVKCYLSSGIGMSLSVAFISVVMVKSIVALFGLTGSTSPTKKTNPVIIQVTCYSEGTDELENTFSSVANLRYGERDRLMVVVCDGLVRGAGGSRTTPELVLGILFGDEIPKSSKSYAYEAIGEGRRQLNKAMIYSGVWQDNDMEVYKPLPFIVIVKCGTDEEREKPGNRGKRDSQVMLMRFLNRVYGGDKAVLSPFELRLWEVMEQGIGRPPTDYEFFCMIDADTVVRTDSLNHLVSSMTNDDKIIGICGLTEIANQMESWVTCIQVFEYFIQHYLGKNFESVVGSVTCLPGCFCMYRIRSADARKPKLYFVSSDILEDYSVTKVDTLHKKNLLTLGEDRFLTTCMLKHFPDNTTKFNHNAVCETRVPKRIGVFFSQRRRWINSTIHNLWVLMGISELRGCMCFSLRFIIFVEFISALISPAAVLYLYYLAIMVYLDFQTIPFISGILLASVYLVQIAIAFVKLRWEHLGWMIIFIIFSVFPPILTLFLPLYAFWHMDDFSWGNTRTIVQEGGKRTEVPADDLHFDITAHVRYETWQDYCTRKLKRRIKKEKRRDQSVVSSVAPSYIPDYQSTFSYLPSVPSVPVPPPLSVVQVPSMVHYPPSMLHVTPPSDFDQTRLSEDSIRAESSVSNVHATKKSRKSKKSKS